MSLSCHIMFPFVVIIIWFNTDYKPIRFLLESLCCIISFLPKHPRPAKHSRLIAITHMEMFLPARSHCTGKENLHFKWPRAPNSLSLHSKLRSATFFGEKGEKVLCNETIRVEGLTFGRPNKAKQKAHWLGIRTHSACRLRFGAVSVQLPGLIAGPVLAMRGCWITLPRCDSPI